MTSIVCGASRERIGVVELGIVKDASHILTGFLRSMKNDFGRVAEWEFADGV